MKEVEDSSKNKRIAKNTLMLYFRMLLTMGVSLYTSRIVLSVLGVEDYGVNNVVGGIVTMFAFFSGSMAAATQRFFSFEIGKNNTERLTKTFSATVQIHFIIAIIIVLLAETVGLWFLNTKMTLPQERMNAIHWVYQLSILTFAVSVTQVPYNAAIIAYEKMNVFAYMSILEVILKLVAVFILRWLEFDKLILFSILTFSVSLLIRLLYIFYVKKNLKYCYYTYVKDKDLFFPILRYAGYNIAGHIALMAKTQGVNVLLNIFFGPVINAANAVAVQVKVAIDSFIENFIIAVNPQVVKSYAANNLEYMKTLIFQSSKFSFLLLSLFSIPFLLEADFVLHLWLKTPPEFSVVFCQLIIINVLIDRLSGTIGYAALATGNVKKYQLVVASFFLLNLPISYLCLKLGFLPQVVFYISICISFIVLFVRLYLLKELINFPILIYLTKVVKIDICIFLLSLILPVCIVKNIEPSFIRLMLTTVVSVFSISILSFFLGLDNNERRIITNKVKSLLSRIKKRK